jgi:hypothetical protein
MLEAEEIAYPVSTVLPRSGRENNSFCDEFFDRNTNGEVGELATVEGWADSGNSVGST